jgi:hypothetical protein
MTGRLIISNPIPEVSGAILLAYGSLFVADGSTPQTIDLAASKLTAWTGAGESRNMTLSAANDNITIGRTGVYAGSVSVSFSGSPNTDFEIHLYNNGVEQDEGVHRLLGAGGDVGSATFGIGPKTFNVNDVVDVRANNANADGRSMTVVDAQFILFEVG